MDTLKILLIEDDPDDVQLVRAALDGEGLPFVIRDADSLSSARLQLDAWSPDAILLDLTLPDGQGLDVLAAVRAMRPETPIVVLTEGSGEADGLQSVQHGAQDHLPKEVVNRVVLRFSLRHAVERVRIEQALAETQARMRCAIDNLDAVFFSTDVGGDRPPVVSAGAERILGTRLPDPVRETAAWRQLLHPDDCAVVLSLLAAGRAGDGASHEFRIRPPSGPVRWVRATLRPMKGPDGAVLRLDGLLRDITAEREAADQARAVERLREQEEFRALFLSTAAHELNAPLTPIRLQLASLRRQLHGPLTPAQGHALDVLERSFARLTARVCDLLDATRLQTGKLRMRKDVVDVSRLVRELEASCQAEFDEAGVALDMQVEPGLHAQGDPDRLMQVLLNLVRNAIRYTPKGGRVTVAAHQKGGRVTVCVADTGVGLDPEQIGRLFVPFTQVHAKDDFRKGSGLGLVICKGIVEQHGGRLMCHSQGVGHGASFVFEVPCEVAVAS